MECRTCVVAFLNFFETYDTLNRDFSFACVHKHKVSEGFVAWSSFSKPLRDNGQRLYLLLGIEAGVNPDYLLSLLLYLVRAQALL